MLVREKSNKKTEMESTALLIDQEKYIFKMLFAPTNVDTLFYQQQQPFVFFLLNILLILCIAASILIRITCEHMKTSYTKTKLTINTNKIRKNIYISVAHVWTKKKCYATHCKYHSETRNKTEQIEIDFVQF